MTATATPDAGEVVGTHRPDKPTLNASERKALKDLVDNDFESLSRRLMQAKHDRERELSKVSLQRAEEERERAQEWVDKAHALNDKQRKEREAFVAKAAKAGVSFAHKRNVLEFTGIPSGLEDEKRNLQRDYDAAVNALREQWLAAERLILLTGVPPTGPARDVLDSIPSAESLMAQAATKRQAIEA